MNIDLTDNHVLGSVYREQYPSVYHFILHRVQSSDVAEDLTADTFYCATRWRHTFSGDHPGPWLKRIAQNVIFTYIRRLAHQDVTMIPFNENHGSILATQEDRAISQQSLEHLLDILHRRLTKNYFTLFCFHVLGDLTYQEIADKVGKPVGTVKASVYHARRNAQQQLRTYSQYKDR